VKPKTLVSYESSLCNHVLPVFTGNPVGTINYRDAKQFVSGLAAKKLAPGTIALARSDVARLSRGELGRRLRGPQNRALARL